MPKFFNIFSSCTNLNQSKAQDREESLTPYTDPEEFLKNVIASSQQKQLSPEVNKSQNVNTLKKVTFSNPLVPEAPERLSR